MADRAIVDTSTETAPKDYQLTGAQQLLVKAVRAEIDGSGAAGSYVPTLQQLAPDGQVMWEAPQDTTLAAGASADVSWFPRGVRKGGGGTVNTGAAAARGYNNAAQTVTAGTTQTSAFGTADTSDATVLSWSTVTHTNDTLTVHTNATVMVLASCLWNVGLAGANLCINHSGGSGIRHGGWDNFQNVSSAPTDGFASLMDHVWITNGGSGWTITVQLENANGFDTGPQEVGVYAVCLPGANP